jgi:hypothetical protein
MAGVLHWDRRHQATGSRFQRRPLAQTAIMYRRRSSSHSRHNWALVRRSPILARSQAIANAVFHATGRRIRTRPITPDMLLTAPWSGR